jgi:EamA-like transporter family
LQIVGYGMATAAAFGLTFAALARIGASHTAVVMTLEAASTVPLAAIVLGEGITLIQALGGLAILAAAVVIARSHARERAQNVRELRRSGANTHARGRRLAPLVAGLRAAGLAVVRVTRDGALVGKPLQVAPRGHP